MTTPRPCVGVECVASGEPEAAVYVCENCDAPLCSSCSTNGGTIDFRFCGEEDREACGTRVDLRHEKGTAR